MVISVRVGEREGDRERGGGVRTMERDTCFSEKFDKISSSLETGRNGGEEGIFNGNTCTSMKGTPLLSTSEIRTPH